MLSYANLCDVSDGKSSRLTKLTFSLCNYEVPTEKGRNTSFASSSNRESPNQRSGIDSVGLEKVASLRYALE